MANRKKSNSSFDRKQWEKMFESLLSTLQIIAGERQLYRDRLISDANLYKEKISQMESEITTLKMVREVDALKSDLLLGMKQRDVFICKASLGTSFDDLKDLKAAFDCVIKDVNVSQISPLISERDFAWNQYKNMECEFTEKLNLKKNEIEQANEEISRILEDVEQLRSSNNEKDSTIQRLKSDIDKLKAASVEKSKEIELLRKSGNGSVTPSLRGCTVTSRMGDKNKGNDSRNNMVKIEPSSSQIREKGTRSSKRIAADSSRVSETPKLFTSSFKVPKLKNPSPRVNRCI